MSKPETPKARIGVLLAQLGTPESPTAQALRPFLRQFLSDPRVVDLHPLKWLPILYLFILTRRPARSAALYRRIWLPEGSPLLLHSQAQTQGLQERLGEEYRVVLGMRYGQPSIERAVQALAAEEIERVLVLPMFPQFSCSTTGSIYDAVVRAAFGPRRMPALRFAPPYYDHPGYIGALKAVVEQDLEAWGPRPDRYLISFHGIPQRYAQEGDPYPQHCQATARLLAASLGLEPGQWLLGFQSRFGKEPWLQPYTGQLLGELGRRQVRRLAVVCPGFTADCLETLDEIGHEGKRQFREGGGEELRLVPCLNRHPAWLDAMAALVRQESAGWSAVSQRA